MAHPPARGAEEQRQASAPTLAQTSPSTPGPELTLALATIRSAASQAQQAGASSPDANACSVLSASLSILHDVILKAHLSGRAMSVSGDPYSGLAVRIHTKDSPSDAHERALGHIGRLAVWLGVEADADAKATGALRSSVHLYAGVLGRLSLMASSTPEGHMLTSTFDHEQGLRIFYAPPSAPRPVLRLLPGGLTTPRRAS